MSAPRKPSGRQFLVLRYLEKNPAQRTTAHVFNEVCGHAKVVRALFEHGYVAGDQVPAQYVSLTDKGRDALAAMTSPGAATPPRAGGRK